MYVQQECRTRNEVLCLKLTSNEVLCEFIALTTLKKNAEAIRAHVLASQGAQNPALKAKVVHKQEE
jgi:hypothetical protein